jgi:WD40 repeat protein
MTVKKDARATNVEGGVEAWLGDFRGRIDADLAALCFAADGSLMGVDEGGTLRRWDAALELMESVSLGDGETVWAFSRDGKWLAGGGDSLSVWNVQSTPKPVKTVDVGWVVSLAFSSSREVLAVGGDDGRVRLFKLPDLKPLATLAEGSGPISGLAFSDGGMFLAVADESRTIKLWGWEEEALLRTLEGCTDRIEAIAWSPDNKRLASAGWDRSVRLWNIRAGELIAMLNDHSLKVLSVAFAPGSDGKLVASGDADGVVRIWDAESLTVKSKLLGAAGAVSRLAFSPDGEKLAAGGEGRVVSLWNWKAGEPVVSTKGANTAVAAIATDNDRIAVVHREGAVHWWSADGNESAPTEANVTAAAFHSAHGWAIGTKTGSVRLPNVAQRHWRSHDGAVKRLAWSAAGDRLVTVHEGDSTLRLWDPTTGELKVVVPEASLGGMVEAVAFHPRDPIMAVAGVDWKDGRIVDPKISLEMWERYTPPKGAIVAQPRMAFQPEGAVVVWDARDWTIRQILEGGALRLAFHPSGKCLAAVSSDGAVLVWDHVTGELLQEFSLGANAADIAFDPTGRFLAAGADDGLLRLWDCKTWSQSRLTELEGAITAVEFLEDGRMVVGFANGVAGVVEVGA